MIESEKVECSYFKEICDTCEGRTCIICCSVEDSDECETIVCPKCKGKGFRWNRVRLGTLGTAICMMVIGIITVLVK